MTAALTQLASAAGFQLYNKSKPGRGVWLKSKQEGQTTGGANRRFSSMFPLTRVPVWHRFFEPQPGSENVGEARVGVDGFGRTERQGWRSLGS